MFIIQNITEVERFSVRLTVPITKPIKYKIREHMFIPKNRHAV